jgi:hypothetical protein
MVIQTPIHGTGQLNCFLFSIWYSDGFEQLDGPCYCASECDRGGEAILVIGWLTKNVLSQAPPCFGRFFNPLVPAVFAIITTHQPALGPRGGLSPVLLNP